MTDEPGKPRGDSDHGLGMDRDISRRDFLNGVAMVAGSLALPEGAMGAARDDAAVSAGEHDPYPPMRTGMRGSQPGSYLAAHGLRDRRSVDLSGAEHTGETYDLVVVGGGLSGLAAAHFFHKSVGPGARVLILDNHDDVGGHARRNEFHYGGRTFVLNGGTMDIESPERYNQWARQVLDDIGADLPRYAQANEANARLYPSLGLRPGYFFDRETFGADRLVVAPAGAAGQYRPPITPDYVSRMPLSERARQDLLRLQDPRQPDYLAGLTQAGKKERLARMSYKDYLLQVAKVDPQAYWFYMALGRSVFGVGADATPALFAWVMGGAGFAGLRLDPLPKGLLADLPGGQHGRQRPGHSDVHFPDGNATLARLLVRRLIPDAVPGTTMEDVGTARVDYARFDRPSNSTRIRLNSTVLNVRHDGDAAGAKEVIVSYSPSNSASGRLYDLRARACVMASWNMMIPYIIPELPAQQKTALSYNVKAPIVYTSVFVRNWKAFEKLGISSVRSPTMYHDTVALPEAVDLGALRHSASPEEPIVLSLTRYPNVPGLPRKEQHRAGRAELLSTTFDTFERNIRDQLARILSPGGFDPRRDILGIMVNRWCHGYSYTYNSLYDPLDWVFTETDGRPCVTARQPYGLITIANADAAASPHTDAAFLTAHWAVEQLLSKRAYPFVAQNTKT
ncbi:MAG TPA: NAD(P)-binding protein [Steroidobacteraceae bacterium]|nr:NAD(P)-binding protein [Steroidobacteraceae bacterium]